MIRKGILIAAIASGVLVSESALARVCLLRSSSGTCTYWSGSVDCENLNATGLGNVKKNATYMSCMIDAATGGNTVPGLVFCSNGGDNVAPGAQAYAGIFSGTTQIMPQQVDRNGNATGIYVKARAELRGLDQYCQNSNWYAIDFVPSVMNVHVNVIDSSGTVTDSATYACSLPSPGTLGWDKRNQKPERRQYDCSQQ